VAAHAVPQGAWRKYDMTLIKAAGVSSAWRSSRSARSMVMASRATTPVPVRGGRRSLYRDPHAPAGEDDSRPLGLCLRTPIAALASSLLAAEYLPIRLARRSSPPSTRRFETQP
jgi:hypothetical protein